MITLQGKVENWCLENHKDWIGLGDFRDLANVRFTLEDNGFGKVKRYDQKDEQAKLNAVDWVRTTSRTLYPKFTDGGKARTEQMKDDADDKATKEILDAIRKIAFEWDIWKDDETIQNIRNLLVRYKVIGGSNNYICWHKNRFNSGRTVDAIKEKGWFQFRAECERRWFEVNIDSVDYDSFLVYGSGYYKGEQVTYFYNMSNVIVKDLQGNIVEIDNSDIRDIEWYLDITR